MISVIVIVKNDRGVYHTLEQLHKLDTKHEIETIVIDASKGKLNDIKESFPKVKWIHYTNENKKITIPEQRNVGLHNSKGNIFVFIDASCIPEAEWLDKLIEPIVSEGEKIVMGRTGSLNKQTLNDIYHEKLKLSKYVSEAPTINLAITKEVIDDIGMFDEKLEYGSDVDLTWRAIENGYAIRYEPSAVVHHDWGTPKDEFKRTFYYGKARTRILLKHLSSKWKNLFTVDSPVLLYPSLTLSVLLILFYPFYLPVFILVNVLLLIKNANEPHPKLIIGKHYVYGFGVIAELYNQFKHMLLMELIFRLEYYFTNIITLNKRLKGNVTNKDFTIFSNNCWAAEVYKELDIKYQTPMVGLYVLPDDYVKMLENLQTYMQYELNFMKKSEKNTYPIGLLHDVELHFMHYKTEEEANEKWNRRKERINYDNLFIELSDRDNLSIETYKRFNKLTYKKICFVTSEKYKGENTILIKEAKKYGRMMDGKIMYAYAKKYFDIAEWLNERNL